MKLFGARANATSPALVLRNAARDISRNRLNLLIEVRHSLHVVQFSEIANPLDDVVPWRVRERNDDSKTFPVTHALCKRLGSLISAFHFIARRTWQRRPSGRIDNRRCRPRQPSR
jgi:hypothetical protein